MISKVIRKTYKTVILFFAVAILALLCAYNASSTACFINWEHTAYVDDSVKKQILLIIFVCAILIKFKESKRFTAESFYKLLNAMGAEVVFNHADYRLMSARVLQEFANFKEVNLFLRGMVPLVGFKSTTVTYERHERIAGESHYPLSKMLALAFDGITSLSVKPIRFITGFGGVVAFVSFIGVIWAIVQALIGHAVSGWASMTSIICFVSGVQLICLGVIGEYIGKIYLEVKHRPRYIISERTEEMKK